MAPHDRDPRRRSARPQRRGRSRNEGATGKTPDRGGRDLTGPAGELPRWVVEALSRVTPAERVGPALDALGRAARAFEEGRFHQSVREAAKAKQLASRDATVRETLGLASYRVGDWQTALRELRTYRRLSGESTHLPIEIDCLRAMGRRQDVEDAWLQLKRVDENGATAKEGIVVYASFLLDEGRIADARTIAIPRNLGREPFPEDVRVWYVAARAAALDGDSAAARDLRDAILMVDPSFPGLDELDAEIASNT